MTIDEFKHIIDKELTRLHEEYIELSNKLALYSSVSTENKSYQAVKYQIGLIDEKKELLNQILTLPAVARVMAMSDFEVEEYKKDNLAELELRRSSAKHDIRKTESRLFEIKSIQREGEEKYNFSLGPEAYDTLLVGMKREKLIEALEKELAELRIKYLKADRSYKQLKDMSLQDIRDYILASIEGRNNYDELIERALYNPLDESKKLLSMVGDDYEKATALAQLLEQYSEVDKQEEATVGVEMSVDPYLPERLLTSLGSSIVFGYDKKKRTSNWESIASNINEYDELYKEEERIFSEQYTDEKIFPLAGRIFTNKWNEGDIPFLENHLDKLNNLDFEQLKNLVTKKKLLSKKAFKTIGVKKELRELETRIGDMIHSMYKSVINWYISNENNLKYISASGSVTNISFINIQLTKEWLDSRREEIKKARESYLEFINDFEEVGRELDRKMSLYEEEKSFIREDINKVLGIEVSKESIPSLDDGITEGITHGVSENYQDEMINKVLFEAQNQADMKEAELRGMTVSELLKMREQENIETLDEDNSVHRKI